MFITMFCNYRWFNVFHSFSLSITSFRCSNSLVVAYTRLHDALLWGEKIDELVISIRRVEKEFPRELFFEGLRKDTNGAVHLGMYLFFSNS